LKLFRNEWLERLTYMPISVFIPFWAITLPLVCWNSLTIPLSSFCGLFIAGLCVWTIFEYIGHRFFFHLELRSAAGQRLIFVMHGNHHDDPSDKLRNMMPLIVTVPVSFALWEIGRLCAGAYGAALFAGFLAGYISYDLIHYLCHQVTFRSGFMGRLRRHHLSHHYAAPDRNFAVSNMVWDQIFRTKTGRASRP